VPRDRRMGRGSLVKSAWLNLRRARYFIGPYSETPDITVLGPPPYYVVEEPCEPEQLGRTIRRAIDASRQEEIALSDLERFSEERGLELTRLAGVRDRRTFERGARYVSFDCIGDDQVLITPHFRKRGYWEPVPEAQWLTLRRPTDAELGEAAITAAERATA
jgi:hypothetical protein